MMPRLTGCDVGRCRVMLDGAAWFWWSGVMLGDAIWLGWCDVVLVGGRSVGVLWGCADDTWFARSCGIVRGYAGWL